MMKLKLIIILTHFSVICFGQSFDIGINSCINLGYGEKAIKHTKNLAEIHNGKLKIENLTMYINKLLKKGNKLIFVSFTTGNTFDEIVELQKLDKSFEIINQQVEDVAHKTAYSFLLNKCGTIIYRIILEEKITKTTLLIDLIGENKIEIEKLYNDKDYINKRLKCK